MPLSMVICSWILSHLSYRQGLRLREKKRPAQGYTASECWEWLEHAPSPLPGTPRLPDSWARPGQGRVGASYLGVGLLSLPLQEPELLLLLREEVP